MRAAWLRLLKSLTAVRARYLIRIDGCRPDEGPGILRPGRQTFRIRMLHVWQDNETPSPLSIRMLKQSASGVLASVRSSTYPGVRFGSSLAAALLDGLFEHPRAAPVCDETHDVTTPCRTRIVFFRNLLVLY